MEYTQKHLDALMTRYALHRRIRFGQFRGRRCCTFEQYIQRPDFYDRVGQHRLRFLRGEMRLATPHVTLTATIALN